jgi:hypothetical protein
VRCSVGRQRCCAVGEYAARDGGAVGQAQRRCTLLIRQRGQVGEPRLAGAQLLTEAGDLCARINEGSRCELAVVRRRYRLPCQGAQRVQAHVRATLCAHAPNMRLRRWACR